MVAVLLILLWSLGFFLARTSLLEPLKEELLAKLCENSSCQADFEKLDIGLFPTPRAVASGVRIAVPGMLSATAKSLTLFPSILPLMAGRVELKELQLTSLQMQVTLPDVSETAHPPEASPAKRGEGFGENNASVQSPELSAQDSSATSGGLGQPSVLSHLGASTRAALKLLSEKAPGLHLRIEQGSIDIIHKTRPQITLRELSAAISLPPDNLSVSIACKSNAWEKLALEGWFDFNESRSKARLIMDHFQSQELGAYLPATMLKPVGESLIDLDLTFASEGPEAFSAALQGSSPSLTLQMGRERSLLNKVFIEGTLHMAAGKLDVRVSRLNVENPQLSLSGQFLIDPKTPEASYHLECLNTDAASVRDVALALAGESQDVLDTFEIIRGGRVPRVIFEARGPSVADLQKADNLVVNGSLQEGVVFIPEIDLMVNDVFGDVLIAHGILEGKNLQGRSDASTGRKGSLTVALSGEDGPFHLDLEIDADLAQLPPVLARVVPNEAFLKELALVREVTGRATGRLILGDTLKAISTRVEANEWSLRGLYQRFPFPLELKAGLFFYEGSTVALKSLQGRAGKSEVLDVSGSFDWSRGPVLELAASTKARLSLDEIFPWLVTLPEVSNNRWNIRSLGGTLSIDSLTFNGPLSRPDDWRFQANCRVEELISGSDLLPDTLHVKSGVMVATPQSLQATNCIVTGLDASLTASGKFTGYMTELQAADLTFQGEIGPRAGEWVSDLIHLPPDLRMRTPVATPRTQLTWAKQALTTLSTVFRVSGGPEVAMDVNLGAQELSINPLVIADQDSNATLGVSIKEGEFGFGFKGNLVNGTLDRLFAKNQLFGGSLTGDLTLQVIPTRMQDSTADGTLTVKDFWYAPTPGRPLTLQDASIEATGKSLALKTATFRVLDSAIELKGNASIIADQVQLDLDLLADGIDWDQLREFYPLETLGGKNGDSAAERGVKLQEMPVRGTLRVHAGHFTFDHYTWKPLRAKLLFAPDGTSIEVTEARLCSIPTPASIIPSAQGPVLLINMDARNLDLDSTLACLWEKKGIITGAFDLQGEITAKVQQQNMSETFQGSLDLFARDGRVYRSTVLAKIFDLLNFTEIYRGRLPDLVREGCAYDSIRARAALKNGKIMVEDAIFDGRCAKMVWTGEVDLASQKVNFTVLVSPLKTVDTVVRNIPLLGHILGGSLVSIPIKVTGDLNDPTVIPLSPSAVGSGLLGTMKRVFQLPFRLIQPLQK